MTALEFVLRQVGADLARARVPFALVGGLAVSVRTVDLLFASSGIEAEIVAEAEPIELLPGLTMGVARVGHLIALKVLSRDDIARPQDLVDLRALLGVASPDELRLASDSVGLIKARGLSPRPRSRGGAERAISAGGIARGARTRTRGPSQTMRLACIAARRDRLMAPAMPRGSPGMDGGGTVTRVAPAE